MTIREKAIAALEARDAGDNRWNVLVMMLSLSVGISPSECVKRIEGLAK